MRCLSDVVTKYYICRNLGSVGDGPVVGANIQVFNRSGTLMAELQSDANAAYNITITTVTDDFSLSLQATGGTDLVTNSTPDFKLAGAGLDTGGQSVANLSPFSITVNEAITNSPPQISGTPVTSINANSSYSFYTGSE
jgi:hypothetical protein